MSKIPTILFPTDFSDVSKNAFKHCLLMARELGAKIILVHAIYPEYEIMDLPVMAGKATQDKEDAAEITLRSFRDYCVAKIQKKHKVKTLPEIVLQVEVGSPINIITTVAEQKKVSLIIMGTSGQHSAMEKIFGSVTTGVIEQAHCPVLVIPAAAPYHSINIIGYATDLKEVDPDHFHKAGRFLKAFNPIIHVVHVSTGDAKDAADFSRVKQVFSEWLPGLQVRFDEVKEKSVEKGLEEFVEFNDVDLLVMHAPQHTLLERIFRRSHTRRMAEETHVPLLLLKTV